MKVIIDRFEGEYAVVEIDVGKFADLPRVLIPDAKQGDVINITVDKEDTAKRKEVILDLMNQVFED